MRITCNGALVGWRAAGELMFSFLDVSPSLSTVLSIWRERGAESRVYDRVGTVTLGFCGNGVAVRGSDSVYECMLSHKSRVSVQIGDIIGVGTPIDLELGFQLFYHRTALQARLRAYPFNDVSSVHLNSSNTIRTDEPQISLSIEPAVDGQTLMTTTPSPVTVHALHTTLPTNFTSQVQGGSNSVAKILGATAGVILLTIVIIVYVIKRRRMKFNKDKKTRETKAKTENTHQVNRKDVEADNKHHDAQIVATNNTVTTKKAVQHKEHCSYNFKLKRCEHAPPAAGASAKGLLCKKENASRSTIISNNHKYSASNGLYASPKANSSSANVVDQCNGTRYEIISTSTPAAVDEKTGCVIRTNQQTAAVYEKAVVYEKAAIYEKPAIYEQPVTYERAVMYEKAPPVPESKLVGASLKSS